MYHWNKIPYFIVNPEKEPTTSISVVIAARNEEKDILNCIYSILNQNFPKNLLEIIVVDDQSEDNTYELCETIQSPLFKLMRLGVYKKTTIQGSKKKAIAYGISHANGKLVVTTDADCIHPANWLNIICQFYEQNKSKLIIGPVNVKSENGLFKQFQLLDFTSTGLINAAGISSQKHYLGSGANLCFEKSQFDKLNAFENNLHIASGDDVFLIQKMKTQYKENINFLKSSDCITLTMAEKKWSDFFRQRLRWASKTRLTGDLFTLFLASIVWIQRMSLALSFGISIILRNENAFYISLSIMLLIWIIDFIVQYKACLFFKCKKSLKWFLPAHILHSFYFLSIGLISWLAVENKWKGRKI